MKRGDCKFGDGKTRGCPLSRGGGGAVVSQLVAIWYPKSKNQCPPPLRVPVQQLVAQSPARRPSRYLSESDVGDQRDMGVFNEQIKDS